MKTSETIQMENRVQEVASKPKWEMFKRFCTFISNVLAAWAGLLVLWFFADQSDAMWEAFLANAADAYEKVTSVKMIVLMFASAIVVAVLKALLKKLPKRKRKVKE